MRGSYLLALIAAFLIAVSSSARAGVRVEVDLGAQSMEVYVDGSLRHSWPVSTGRFGYETPTGSFRARRLEEEWYSTQYDDAPMPHSIFFAGGYAIHGTTHTRSLGRPASHGCVRLSPSHAARLFALVERQGLSNTRIAIYD